jgi:hypothetical protein
MNLAVVIKLFTTKSFVFVFDATSLKMVHPVAACILKIERNIFFNDNVLDITDKGTG